MYFSAKKIARTRYLLAVFALNYTIFTYFIGKMLIIEKIRLTIGKIDNIIRHDTDFDILFEKEVYRI